MLDVEVVRTGGLTSPPLGVTIVDHANHVMCLTCNVTTHALKVVGLSSLITRHSGTRTDELLSSKMSSVFASSVAKSSVDEGVSLEDGAQGKRGAVDPRLGIMESGGGNIHTCAFNAHNRVVTGCKDNSVRVYRVDTGARVGTLYGHTGPVNVVAWANTGRVCASGAEDGQYVALLETRTSAASYRSMHACVFVCTQDSAVGAVSIETRMSHPASHHTRNTHCHQPIP